MGWYMVQSGLVDDPRVSQFRLTAHLGLALADLRGDVLGRAVARHFRARAMPASARGVRRWACALAALVFVMVLTGGFVAGIRAGFAYNTFPLMNGSVVPPEILMLEPVVEEFLLEHGDRAVRSPAHRVAARDRRAGAVVEGARGAGPAAARAQRRTLLLALLALQIALGIATLLLVVPVPLAAAHQAGAVLVFAAALNVAHALR